MNNPLEIIIKKLDEEIARMEHDMGLGSAKDFGAYQYACGIVRGYLMAKMMVIDQIQRYEVEGE